jgi:PadR family transcriptional regulator PadR
MGLYSGTAIAVAKSGAEEGGSEEQCLRNHLRGGNDVPSPQFPVTPHHRLNLNFVQATILELSRGVRIEGNLAHLDILLEAAIPLPRMSTKEQKERIELLQGTLDLLILRTLLLGPTHGHAVAKAIEFNSDDVLQVEQGSLYPALHRLIKRGWISVEEGTSENNRRAKFYRLTAKGRRQLAVETSKWEKLAGAITRILRPAAQEGKP